MMGLIVGLIVIVLIMGAVIFQINQERNFALECVSDLAKELDELKAQGSQPEQDFKELIQEQEDELGFGQHVKWRSTKKPTSQTYRLHFDIEPNGQRILEELTARFKRNVFTDDERETCRRIGRAEVVDFIISRINTANDPRYTEQLELAHMEQNDE
ncbi:Bbp19 family protein [Acinetobacter baumannii]|uniref:Bbp19 family protein n=1 Tax=Acinetobacter baumannii TaxID=470 RepID=UPI001CDD0BDC|nr:hypothetical protein [Acinetobacter baumannii]MCA4232769.1 hypothetical protein [Acinetobacter baumannii]